MNQKRRARKRRDRKAVFGGDMHVDVVAGGDLSDNSLRPEIEHCKAALLYADTVTPHCA